MEGMKILIIDDHPLFSDGLKFIISGLESDVDIQCLYELKEIGTLPSTFIPNLILLDYYFKDEKSLKNSTSENAISELKIKYPSANLVIISGEESPAVINAVLKGGVDGYIPKSSNQKVLISALRLVLEGGVYIPKEATFDHSSRKSLDEPSERLTTRQKEVLALTIQGKPNKVIASELNIAEGTVKAHLSLAFQILDVNNRTEAAILLRDLGLFE